MGCVVVGAIFGSLQNGAVTKGRVDFATATFRTLISPISVPLGQAGRGTGTFLGNILSVNRVVSENRKLKDEEAVFRQYQEIVDDKEKTIEEYRKLMGLPEPPGKTRVFADVVGLSINENRLTIDVGRNQGVSAGCPVVCAEGLVGTVEDVESNRCQVLLLTSAGLQQGANGKASLIGGVDISRNPQTLGLLRGENSNTIRFSVLDVNAPIKIGDTIFTTGSGDKIPAGLTVGKIIQVESNQVYGSLSARVDPAYSISKLDAVYVLK